MGAAQALAGPAALLEQADQSLDDRAEQAVDTEEEQRQDQHEDEHEDRRAHSFLARRPDDLVRFGADLVDELAGRGPALLFFGPVLGGDQLVGHAASIPSRDALRVLPEAAFR